eukprot:g28657.t1
MRKLQEKARCVDPEVPLPPSPLAREDLLNRALPAPSATELCPIRCWKFDGGNGRWEQHTASCRHCREAFSNMELVQKAAAALFLVGLAGAQTQLAPTFLSLPSELLGALGMAGTEFLKQEMIMWLSEELQSRQALPFLEQVVRLSGRSTDISEKMDEAFVKVANFFCSRLDYQDLRLGDALAQGSLKVSLEVLRCHRQDFPPGSKFAATVFQRHLRLEAEAAKAAGCARVAPFLRQPDALVLGMESEEEAEAVPAEHLEDGMGWTGLRCHRSSCTRWRGILPPRWPCGGC